ncbi:hypothetical protein LCGC14_0117850 [marine sediment metagenome]|uniref:CHAT domain-containing protein n=1 Tax=marine sediment metagenome TaxID=412755 RepID=A0A0F9VMR3_9ZZZZ|nr:CHAT domain-containing tetratricopeptide repeat protein [Maribacter sp.]HDZ07292.1 CHAT domain-containing protein [Maribacter sp.]HEA80653.1 CHAT domain-containing protein [Maribacter sp.]
MRTINLIIIVLYFLPIYIWPQNATLSTIDSLNKKAEQHYYYEKDSAYFYFDQVKEIAKEINSDSTLIESLFNTTGVASYHYDLRRISANLNQLDSLIYSTNDFNSDNSNILLYYKGDYHLKLLEYSKSRTAFEKIIKNYNSANAKSETLTSLASAAYSFLGKLYMIEGKYDNAKSLYRKNIRDIEKSENVDLEALTGNYNLLAEVLLKEKKYKEANAYLLKAYAYNKKEKNINSAITNAFHIAENYGHLLQKDSALLFLNDSKKLFINKPIFHPKYHLRKAQIHKNNWEYEIAIIEIDSAIGVIKENFEKQKNTDLEIAYNEKGLLENLLGFHDKALLNFDLALNESLNKIDKDPNTLKLFKNKAATLNLKENEESYQNTISVVSEATTFLNQVKPSFKNSVDKLFLIDNAYPIFESGIEASYNLYKLTKNNSYIDNAFQFAENSKSVLLLEALLSSQATQFASIPNKVLAREAQLKAEITHIEREITISENIENSIEDKLFHLNQELRNLIVDIEKKYPAYYNLKYNSKVLSLAEAQENLAENELLVSYFYGSQNIYTIAATKNKKHIESITTSDKLESDINNLHGLLSNPKSNLDSLSLLSHSLYKILLAPVLSNFTEEKLIIIPDGLLNYIPFESLVSNPEKNTYLIQDKTISYVNSVTLLSQLNGKKQVSTKLLAFAPSFNSTTPSDGTRSQVLGNLPHNRNEVQQILTSFTGKSFINDQATLQNFTAILSDYSVLHLATHAVFDDKNPEYSYLAFTPNTASDDLLFVKDLYNLTLNASLVTLSGCESGIGELKRGEGFLSLARGFFYSGAASITSTLWKINDNSSSDLMGNFYLNLADGKAKDESLREAKLTFLEKNKENGLSHPYWWSGYIIQGNTKPLLSSSKWHWILYCSIVILLLFLGRKRLVQLFK